MQQKILSFLVGVILGTLGCIGYHHMFTQTPDFQNRGNFENRGGNFSGEMTSEMKEQMASRLGITTEELQKELDSGKDMRAIMQEHGGGFGGENFSRRGSGSINNTQTSQMGTGEEN